MLFSGSPYLLARAVFTLKASASSNRQLGACMSESYSEIAKLYDAMRVRNSFRSASVNLHICIRRTKLNSAAAEIEQ